MRLIDRSVLPGFWSILQLAFWSGPFCPAFGRSSSSPFGRSVLPGFWSILQLAFWSVCPARLWADPSPRQPGRTVRLTGVPALSYAGGRIVRAGHAVPKWSFRPESAVAVGPDDERGGRITDLLVGCCANQKATVSPLIVTLPKTAVALSLLLPLLTATPRQRVSGSPPSKLSVRTLPKVAPPSSE